MDYTRGQQIVYTQPNGAVTLTYTYAGNGQWSVSDTAHGAWPTNVPTSQVPIGQQSATPIANQPVATTGSSSTPTTPTVNSQSELNTILADPNLTADQKAAIQSIYNATVSNDANTVAQLQAALQAASTYSDPYFKAQIRLATDALSRGISSKEGDLAFQDQQLKSALQDLQANTAASKDKLSLDHAQALHDLQTKYENDLASTQDSLASAGFTSSSRRTRAEGLLSDQNQGLVQTENRNFGYSTGVLDRALASKQTDTAAQIANLQRLTNEGKLDLLRNAENTVGTQNLTDLGYTGTLGGVGGTIPRQQASDAFQFASNFVF